MDPRIIMAEKCLMLLGRRRTDESIDLVVRNLDGTLKRVRQMPGPGAAEYLNLSRFMQVAITLENQIGPQLRPDNKFETNMGFFCLRILAGLENRMQFEDRLKMIDVIHSRILKFIELGKGLQKYIIDCGTYSGYYGGQFLELVSEEKHEAGEECNVAFVPPEMLGDKVVRGVFLEDEEQLVNTPIGQRPMISEAVCGPALDRVKKFLGV